MQAWFDDGSHPENGTKVACQHCGGAGFERDKEGLPLLKSI